MLLLERAQIVGAFRPVDMSAAANAGDWVSLKNYRHVAIVFHSAIGTAGDDPTLTILQATSVAGASSKALNINTAKAYKKQAATNLLSTAQWSSASADVSTNTWTHTDAAEQEVLVVIEFDSDELDVDNGFDCLQASVADVGTNAQLGACYYVLTEPRNPDGAASMAGAIAD
jgi:hypothetical protein